MITIDLNLSSILVTVICSVVSIAVTWWFSKRHYTRPSLPITENDIKMQRIKNDYLTMMLWVVLGALVIGGLLA